MAQLIKALATLPEDPPGFNSQPQPSVTLDPGEANALFWLPSGPDMHMLHTHIQAKTFIYKN